MWYDTVNQRRVTSTCVDAVLGMMRELTIRAPLETKWVYYSTHSHCLPSSFTPKRLPYLQLLKMEVNILQFWHRWCCIISSFLLSMMQAGMPPAKQKRLQGEINKQRERGVFVRTWLKSDTAH